MKILKLHREYSVFKFWTGLTFRNLCNNDIRSLTRLGLILILHWCPPVSGVRCPMQIVKTADDGPKITDLIQN